RERRWSAFDHILVPAVHGREADECESGGSESKGQRAEGEARAWIGCRILGLSSACNGSHELGRRMLGRTSQRLDAVGAYAARPNRNLVAPPLMPLMLLQAHGPASRTDTATYTSLALIASPALH
ncbi:hypothetical protein J1614_000476, partial [Plenodomus biglobosus]